MDFAVRDLVGVRSVDGVIAHQCNCVTSHAAGVARKIFSAFPYSDSYKDRKVPGEAGTIDVRRPPAGSEHLPAVVNLFAQYYPGKPRDAFDTNDDRNRWRILCLKAMAESLDEGTMVFVPYRMGCSLAGGNWDEVLEALKGVEGKIKITICIA